MKNIPFSLKKVYEGLAKTEGLLRYENDTVWLEFQTKDSFFGLIKSEIKKVPMHAKDLESAALKHRMRRSYLTLRSTSLSALEQLPNRDGAEVVFEFKRQYRDELDQMMPALLLAISEAKIARLDDAGMWD